MSSSLSQQQAGEGRGFGRAAGVGYLAIALTATPWYAIWQGLRAGGDAALVGHIQASRLLFELSVLAGALSFVAYLVTAAFLYLRYKAEAPIAVTLLFAFVVGSVPFSLVAISHQLELLSLLDATGLTAQDRLAQAGALVRGFDAVGELSSLFWGLWLLPLAWLAWRSGGWGRPAGAFLALGGLGYITGLVRPLLLSGGALPPLAQDAFLVLAFATVASELSTILWLLLASDRPPKRAELRAAAAV